MNYRSHPLVSIARGFAVGTVLLVLLALLVTGGKLVAAPAARLSVPADVQAPTVTEPDLVGLHRSLVVKDTPFEVDALWLSGDVLLHLVVNGIDATIVLPPASQLSGSTPAVWVTAVNGGRFTVADPDGGADLMTGFTTRGAALCNSEFGRWLRVQ